MKRIITIIVSLAFVICAPAFAASTPCPAGSTSSSCATSGSTATNQGNAQSITFTSPADSTQTVKNVPSIGAPSLTTSNDTCMGSSSVGAAGIGFGITIGSTWTDNNCTMLKNSRELWNMGMKAAALARLCMDEKNRESLEETGFKCPDQKKDKNQK